MSEDYEYWLEYRSAQKERRANRLPIRVSEILDLAPEYEVKMLTEFQFRINGTIDIYPIHACFHNIKKNKRGVYKPNQLKEFLIKNKI